MSPVRGLPVAFVGVAVATAFGDYAAGSNHVLPTGGAARYPGRWARGRFCGGTSVVTLDAAAAKALAPSVDEIARAEVARARRVGTDPDAQENPLIAGRLEPMARTATIERTTGRPG